MATNGTPSIADVRLLRQACRLLEQHGLGNQSEGLRAACREIRRRVIQHYGPYRYIHDILKTAAGGTLFQRPAQGMVLCWGNSEQEHEIIADARPEENLLAYLLRRFGARSDDLPTGIVVNQALRLDL